MSDEFYGASATARQHLNRLLNLPASGQEQDWEIELASPARLHQMLDLAKSDLPAEDRLALFSLIIASLDEAVENSDVRREIELTRRLLEADTQAKAAMTFYWLQQNQLTNEELGGALGLN